MAAYSSGSPLDWREVEGGQLPSPRGGLRATRVGDILFVTGGRDVGGTLSSILSWDPVDETWQAAGDLVEPRGFHAAVAVPRSVVECL